MPLEQDKSGGFKLPLQNELQTGIWRDTFSRNIPLWQDGSNVRFTELGVKKLAGFDLIADTTNSEPIRGILQQDEDSNAVIYAGDLTTLYKIDADDGTVETKGTGYSLAEDAGGSVWDSGSSTWDSGTTIFDDGVIRAGQWSLINYGTFILATNGADTPQIKKTAGNFTSLKEQVNGIFLSTPGTGYTQGDTLTLTGGDGTGATAEVLAVGGSGEITSVGMLSGGSGYSTVPTGATGGTGTGATFTFSVSDFEVDTVEVWGLRGPHILGFNTSQSDREVIWCDADDPDTWVTAADNLAGALEIRELKSPIRAAVPLGPRIAIYGDDQLFLLTYLGNELVFGYQPALNGIGAVSSKSVVAVGSQNYGLSRQGFFVTDGAAFRYIDRPIRTWYRENIAAGQLSKAIAYHDEKNSEVRWHFPTDDIQANTGVAYNYSRDVWTFVGSDRSAGEERVVLGQPVSGDSNGRIYAEGLTENEAGAVMTAFAQSKPIDLGDADKVKELSSIRIGFEGDGLQYRVGWSETEGGTINWGPYRPMEQGFDFDNLRTAGRWLHFELYSDTLNANWEAMSMEFIGRVEGTR